MSDEERAELVEQMKEVANFIGGGELSDTLSKAAALLEADGKRLALADAAPHEPTCCIRNWRPVARWCNCWKRDYDAAKEPGL